MLEAIIAEARRVPAAPQGKSPAPEGASISADVPSGASPSASDKPVKPVTFAKPAKDAKEVDKRLASGLVDLEAIIGRLKKRYPVPTDISNADDEALRMRIRANDPPSVSWSAYAPRITR